MPYHPQQYWQRRGQSYTQAPPRCEIENLQQWMWDIKPKSILEVGSGWGAIYQALASIGLGHVTTLCDISSEMAQNCASRTGVLPVLWDGVTLPFESDKFETVISFNVMLHVELDNIERFIADHIRVAQKYLFVATYAPAKKPDRLSAHCFTHDYDELFEGLTVSKQYRFNEDRKHWLLTL